MGSVDMKQRSNIETEVDSFHSLTTCIDIQDHESHTRPFLFLVFDVAHCLSCVSHENWKQKIILTVKL